MGNYKEQLLEDLQSHQKGIENAKKNLEWAKACLEYEKTYVKRARLALMMTKVRIYGYETGYNKIHKKQDEWCDKIWYIYTEQINKALDKMNKAIDKKNMVKSKN